MAIPEDPLAAIESKRALLEDNVATLRKTLQLWQKWSFEYEALKEEVDALPINASTSEVKRVGHAFEGDLLNRKEIDELLGLDKGSSRSAEQVSSLLSRRLDYVVQNVGTVQKQLDATELKLADIGSDEIPFIKQDDILPVTEILEELDEEGNVVSSKLSRPGEETSGLVDVLKKAGINDDDMHDSKEDDKGAVEAEKLSSTEVTPNKTHTTANSPRKSSAISKMDEPQKEEGTTARRKSVTFAENTKPESSIPAIPHKFSPKSPSPLSSQVSQPAMSQPEPSKTKVYTNFAPQNRVIELNDEDQEIGSSAPIIAIDESDEDAAMRREMLAYSMNEVGSIVAQLDLEESYYSNEEDEEDDDDQEEGDDYGTATDEEDETEFGMSTKSAMDEEYRKEMLELEERLGARYFENLGPQALGQQTSGDDEAVDVQQLAKHTARVAVKDDEDMPKRPTRRSTQESPTATAEGAVPKAKKGVRFAEDLDVAPVPSKPTSKPASTRTPSTPSAVPGVRDTILERTPTVSSTATPAVPEAPTPKVSRFKAARAAATKPTTAPGISRLTTPSDSPILSKIVERAPASPSLSTIPSEPDELDPEMLRKQVAEEYYKQRNRRIAKQGGFRQEVQDEQEMEDDANEYDNGDVRDLVEEEEEEEEEAPKKMSLFKKARLKKGQGW